MKRLLLVPFLLLALVACGGTDVQEPGGGTTTAPAPGPAPTSLQITVWADPASSAAPTSATVDKAPTGATVKDFAPTAADQPCTEIYGGPGKATVTGTLDGAAVNATFTRSNGCEIARWEKMVQLGLLPAGVGGM
jgi:hypothetical protein